jgi:hypothetical protein
VKPLEVELREMRRYLTQIEDELASTKIKLRQNEAVAWESSTEIDRLQNKLSSLMGDSKTGRDEKSEILSIKLLAEMAVQTNPQEDHHRIHYPDDEIISSHVSPRIIETGQQPIEGQSLSVEKLTHELSITMKAKVDLLRELSKLNKGK